jgi:hypothetical protein
VRESKGRGGKLFKGQIIESKILYLSSPMEASSLPLPLPTVVSLFFLETMNQRGSKSQTALLNTLLN